MKGYKKNSKTQKLYNMKGCSLARCKKHGGQKGGCGCSLTGGRSRRYKKMMAYPASNADSQTAFSKDYLAYTSGGGFPNPDLPYGPINEYGGGMRGGNSGKWPDGLTGSAWGSQTQQLPGADGISGNRNYYSYNNYNNDPQTQGVVNGRALSGGARRRRYGNTHSRKHRQRQRGGGLIPQDLVNVGRQMIFGAGSVYNGYNGYTAPVNPMPWSGQLSGTPNVNDLNYYRL